MALSVTVEDRVVRIGSRFSMAFLRTLRVPDDGQRYPLPPGLGELPVHRIEDFADRVPPAWRQEGGVFVPLYQREALWLALDSTPWKPNAVKVAVGDLDAVSGVPWDDRLRANPQNYVVCPPQPWLDGVNVGNGLVRQFVAAPLGAGLTVEARRLGREAGGFRVLVFEPRPGRFPDARPPRSPANAGRESVASAAMGIAAGGHIQQKIYADPHGLDTWDPQNFGALRIHVLNTAQYRAVTGASPPPSPVDAHTYTEAHLPWFELYDEHLERAPDPAPFDLGPGLGQSAGAPDRPLDVPERQVSRLRMDPDRRPRPGG